ncbi:quinone-dependent dihydroorotate dehydrogenase [Halocatena halophila]|uniref:quinone-dependent dihydroorotate dehydrogenase n=1 Tax=Halocatena halophila TaxID=2814576 RepID=UPI0038B29491
MDIYDVAKPLLFQLPPETAHGLITRGLRGAQTLGLDRVYADRLTASDPRLTVSAFGQTFSNPVGLAAGFDKNAKIPAAVGRLGFGHVEVGGVTAESQPGNPRPRLFRLASDRALINRMGFNNDGADAVGERLSRTRVPVPVGVNIGKSKSTPLEDAPEDYRYTFNRVKSSCEYVVVNVSSPNTPGLRKLQHREHLTAILGALAEAGADPLLVKLSPDLSEDAIEDALAVVDELDLDGVITTNTTTERPESLESINRVEMGGLSGDPIEKRSTEAVRFVAERTDVPVIGVGGISDAKGAYAKIRAGASLVQLYTGLIYEGPTIAREINRGLLKLLERDGFDSIEAAVGVDLE